MLWCFNANYAKNELTVTVLLWSWKRLPNISARFNRWLWSSCSLNFVVNVRTASNLRVAMYYADPIVAAPTVNKWLLFTKMRETNYIKWWLFTDSVSAWPSYPVKQMTSFYRDYIINSVLCAFWLFFSHDLFKVDTNDKAWFKFESCVICRLSPLVPLFCSCHIWTSFIIYYKQKHVNMESIC